MLNNKYKLLAVLFLALLMMSCNKEPEQMGFDFITDNKFMNLSSTDTVSISAYTVMDDTLSTHRLEFYWLGSTNDPVFGTTSASLYTQFSHIKDTLTILPNATADSVVLMLRYSAVRPIVYGDSLYRQKFNVYGLTDTINGYVPYHSQSSVPHTELLGSAEFVPNLLRDTTGALQETTVRIRLNKSFATKIISGPAETYLSRKKFYEHVKGLVIVPEKAATPGTGSMLRFGPGSLSSGYSAVNLYYHTPDTNIVVVMPLARSFNHYDQFDYASAETPLREQLKGELQPGLQNLYLQGTRGLNIHVDFPYLNDLTKLPKIAVNEAILTLYAQDTTSIFNEVQSITIYEKKGDEYFLISDMTYQTNQLFSGARKLNRYQFRISRFIQQKLNGSKPDSKLVLTVSPPTSPERVKIYGPGSETLPMDLKIYYTEID